MITPSRVLFTPNPYSANTPERTNIIRTHTSSHNHPPAPTIDHSPQSPRPASTAASAPSPAAHHHLPGNRRPGGRTQPPHPTTTISLAPPASPAPPSYLDRRRRGTGPPDQPTTSGGQGRPANYLRRPRPPSNNQIRWDPTPPPLVSPSPTAQSPAKAHRGTALPPG
ncbi:hypothetical protein VPH35_073716 [Triticum aestivum]